MKEATEEAIRQAEELNKENNTTTTTPEIKDDEVVDVERVRLKERLYKMNVDTTKYFHQNLLNSFLMGTQISFRHSEREKHTIVLFDLL